MMKKFISVFFYDIIVFLLFKCFISIATNTTDNYRWLHYNELLNLRFNGI